MTKTTLELRKNMGRTVELLKTLRDEMRVEAHLAGMNARDTWARAERKLGRAEQAGRRAAEAVSHAVDEIARALRAPGNGNGHKPAAKRIKVEVKPAGKGKLAAKPRSASAHA